MSKPASAIERARSSLAEDARLTPIPTSSSGSSTSYQPSAKPFSFGPLSQNMIEPSNAPSSTPISTPSSSSTPHQSSLQHFRFGPYAQPPPQQTRNQRAPVQDKVEAQAARIKALESGFDVLTERYEKASGLADKYEGLLKTVEKEYVDKVKASENDNALVLAKVADSYEARIKALQDQKMTLGKLKEMDLLEWERKHSILMETNEEQVATISSLTKTKAELRNELTSSLAAIEGLKKKIERLTASDRKWEDLVDTIGKDNEELRAKNAELKKQNGEFLVIVSALHETRVNLERELRGSLQILEMLETDDSLELNRGDNEMPKNLIERSEKDDDEAVHASGQQEAEPAKDLEEVSLSAPPAGSSEKMKEPSEKKANSPPRQNLRFLGLLLLFFATMFVVVWWMIPFEEWMLKPVIDIERAFFSLRIWIFE